MVVATEHLAVAAGEHAVQFYADESEWAHTVGRYLSDAVLAGATAVVIATEAHRRAVDEQLVALGVDPDDCLAQGALMWIDAAETVAEFMDDGHVDRAAVRRVIGGILSQAGSTGRPVRAYGEMVALLWEAGNVVAAIELEEGWNELAHEFPFALLCAYHSEAVLGDERSQALLEVCHLHSSVSGAPAPVVPYRTGAAVSAEFPADLGAPSAARHFVVDALAEWGLPGSLCERAELVVSELATNALVHARSAFSVSVRAQDVGVHLSVSDGSRVAPAMGEPTLFGPSGRGLRLVGALAAQWGVELVAGGKTVWAQLEA